MNTLKHLLLENKQITFPDNYGIDYETPVEILYDEELAKIGLIEACLPSHVHIEKYVNNNERYSTMKDCTGKELQVGDKIVAADGKYAELLLGEVISFTSKKIRISAKLASQQDTMEPLEFLKYPWQVFKQ